VFTGVSGSGKSSLVFGTIAAESQRMINETYSAFVQGFMPTLARPEVDVLDGLTTAIIVDQQRMGADPRSTVGTGDRRQRDAADPVQPAGQAVHRPARRVRLQRPVGARQRRDHVEKGGKTRPRRRPTTARAACARAARAAARSPTST
jgi:hypothetical protein